MNKLLIFDLDGTLVDCKQLHRDAFRSAIGGKWYPEDRVEGLPTVEKIKILQELHYYLNPPIVIREKARLTSELFDEYIQYNPELNKRLSELSQQYDLALCSNAVRPFVERCVDTLNIRLLLSCGIWTATEYPAKPDVTMWQSCIESWAGELANVTIFEDSPVGIMGARSVGCGVVEVQDSVDLLRKLDDF